MVGRKEFSPSGREGIFPLSQLSQQVSLYMTDVPLGVALQCLKGEASCNQHSCLFPEQD